MEDLQKLIREEGFEEVLDSAYDLADNTRYSEAAEYFRALLEYSKTALDVLDEEISDILEELANCLRIVGKRTEALEIYDRLIARNGISPDYLFVKAELYQGLSQFEKAAELRQQAFDMIIEKYGENSIKSARAMIGIAENMMNFSQYDEAEKLYFEALRIYRENQATDFDTARLLQNIGRLYEEKVDDEKALQFYEDALSLMKKERPEDNIDVLSIRNDIAGVLKDMGNFRASANVYEELLQDCYDKFGENSYNTYICEGNLAELYSIMKEFDKAHKLRQRAMEGFFREDGEQSRDYHRQRANFASDLAEQGKFEESAAAFEDVYELYKKYLGEHNLKTVDVQRVLASQYKNAGNIAKAVEIYEKVVAEYDNIENEEYCECLTKVGLAKCYVLTLDFDKAEPLIERVKELWGKFNRQNKYIEIILRLVEAYILLEKKSFGEAEHKAELAFELADDDIDVKRECAEILAECGQLEKAEKLLMRTLNSVPENEYNSCEITKILCRLAEIKSEQGDAEQANFFAERARERLPENYSIREEFALRYMEMIIAKHRGDLSRFEVELDRVRRIANDCFAGNKWIVKKING